MTFCVCVEREAVSVMLAFNDVIAPVLLYQIRAESRQPLEYWYFGGIVLGILLVLLLQKHFKLNICLMLNLSLALLAAGFVMMCRTVPPR